MKTNELMEECRKKFDLDKANNKISLEIGHLDRAYMIGYNVAYEKALEWLSRCVGYESRESVMNGFKQALHPYSVEQIDNCINMK